MSLPATIAQAIVETVLGRIAVFFLAAAGNMSDAQEAARQMLASHHPETPDELILAAEIIGLQFHTIDALSAAKEPDLAQNKVLRLRGSAVSLSRESHKAQRKLDQLQHARRTAIAMHVAVAPSAEVEAASSQPVLENPAAANHTDQKDTDQMEALRQAIQIVARGGGKKWLDAFQKRQAAERITQNLKKNQAKHAAQVSQAAPTANPPAAGTPPA